MAETRDETEASARPAGDRDSVEDSKTIASGRDLTIPAADGYPLAATVYENGGAWLVFNSATGVKRGFYSAFAGFLASRGFSVVTYDYRGIGGSAPESIRGFEGRMQDWGKLDFAGVLDWVEQRSPEVLGGIGHSVGGQILGMVPGAGRLSCFVGVACQSGWWGYWDPPLQWILRLLWRAVFPLMVRTLGYVPASRLGMGEDLPPGIGLEWARWCRHRHYYRGHLDDTPGFDDFRGPLLAYSFSNDPFGPRAAVEAWIEWFSKASAEHRHIKAREVGLKRLGHFEFFRRRSAHLFWDPCLDWLRSSLRMEER